MSQRKIVIATENKGKVDAVIRALEEYKEKTKNFDFNIETVSVESEVPSTPTTDLEGIQGCTNRIKNAKKTLPEADIYISMEGVTVSLEGEFYIRGWTKIEDCTLKRSALASGASVPIPNFLQKHIDPAKELGSIFDGLYELKPEEKENLRNIGANGIFTEMTYSRFNTFHDGVLICLSTINNGRNWL